MATAWKFNVSITTVLLIVGIAILLLCSDSLCNSPRIEGHSSLSNAIKWLTNHSYVTADPVNKPTPHNLPKPVQESAVTTTHGTGIWIPDSTVTPDDTLAVELSVIVLEDESAWGQVTIGGKPAVITELKYYRRDTRSRLGLFAEYSNSGIGCGINYRLFAVANTTLSPAVAVSTQLDWVAGEVQLSRTLFGNVSAGVGCGYQLSGDSGGLHFSGLVSIGL
jgi:hypothetical protein